VQGLFAERLRAARLGILCGDGFARLENGSLNMAMYSLAEGKCGRPTLSA